ncbi:MAG: hypothetical protein K8F58_05125 [Bauldia sp.]|nr:hypothetical protein [Bauldia sp.]
MGTLSQIRSLARSARHRYIETRRRRHTERVIESLDLHILKDIGWVRSEYDHLPAHRRMR